MAKLEQGLSLTNFSVVDSRGKSRLQPISHGFKNGLCAVLGPNGAGKSTLLQALAGQEKFSGSIHLDGVDITATAEKRLLSHRVAYLPQRSGLQFPLMVYEVIELAWLNWQLPAVRRQQLLEQVAELFDLQPLWQHDYLRLSGGQQARVQLARVYAQLLPGLENGSANGSQVLLLDEPVAALDIPFQHKTLQLLGQISKQLIILVVLHDINLALRYSDTALLIKQGVLMAAGETNTVLTAKYLQRTFDAEINVVSHPDIAHPVATFR